MFNQTSINIVNFGGVGSESQVDVFIMSNNTLLNRVSLYISSSLVSALLSGEAGKRLTLYRSQHLIYTILQLTLYKYVN